MGCESCGTGKPGGCKSNGGCSTGGCNRMNVHDWLINLPFADPESSCKVIEMSFNNGSRKDFYRNTTLQWFEKGDMVSIEGVSGFDVGEVTLTGEMVRLQLKKKGVDEFSAEMKRVLRRATDRDLELLETNKKREKAALVRARAITRQLNLNMKMSEVEIQADGRKATFFYIADDRVDFRELIKILASEFKVKVEMRQIGARQEAGKVGGIGSCGRELCCSTWLTDFKSVNTTAARYQNLSINQTKLSGQCGRLKCCLNYELDTYLDALQHFPENADTLQVGKGTALLIKKDIFRNLMWYVVQDSSKHFPVTIERVKKIKQLNAQGIIPEELEAVEVTTGKPKEVEPEFVDVVGQISLRTLEKSDRKKRNANDRGPQRDGRDQRGPGDRGQGDQRGPGGRPQRDQPQARRDDRGPRPDNRAPRGDNDQPQQNGGQPQARRDDRGPRQDNRGPRPDNRGPRPEGDQQQGRGPRPENRRPRPDGDPNGEQPQPRREERGPRQDNRGPRPDGEQPQERGPRPDNRGPRPDGEPNGDQPQGRREQRGPRQDNRGPREDRGPRPDGEPNGEQPQARREERGPRPDNRGPREDRAPREDRGPRPDGEPNGEQPQARREERGPRPDNRGPREDRGPRPERPARPDNRSANPGNRANQDGDPANQQGEEGRETNQNRQQEPRQPREQNERRPDSPGNSESLPGTPAES